jgi:hypothetical protein
MKKSVRKHIIRYLAIFILTLTSNQVFSQFFDSEQNPPSVKFRQINTPQFQIIYPTLLESEAQKMANVLTLIVADVSKSLGHQPSPISIILQNQGVVSNGFVQMAPRRSEFYTIPGQEFDAQDWLNSLAVHELRHVVQFDKLAHKLNAPLFEELKLALFGINLPPWFFEGDAVGIETILTKAGRGRQPNFDLVLRTNLLSNQKYSYSKNYLGSLKDFTPGYYPLGYFMTTKIRRDFGPQILDNILERIKKFPIRPYNFSNALKKFGGYNTPTLYKKTMNEMDSLWKDQITKNGYKDYTPLNQEIGKNPSAYLLPYAYQNNGFICIKSSKAKPAEIIQVDVNQNEKTILKIGYQTEPNLNYAADKITWDEYRIDKRYGQRSYNVICTYNLKTQHYKQITNRSRLFSPALSSDGKKIVAVKVTEQNIFNIVIIDSETGDELISYPNPLNYTLQTPSFIPQTDEIIATAVNGEGKTIIRFSEIGNEILLPQIAQIIARPIFYLNKIIYKAHYNGIDNIYALDLNTKEITALTNSKFGAYNQSIDLKQQKLYFNDYQTKGYNAVSVDLKELESIPVNKRTNTFVNYFEPLIKQENTSDIFKSIPNQTYQSKKYSDVANFFYFHSASIINETNEFTDDYNYGISLLSNNKLNTTAASLGYVYNNALNKSEYRASLTYQKFYPQISLNWENRARLSYAQRNNGGVITAVPFTWRENYSSLRVALPANGNWLNKNFYSTLALSTNFTQRYEVSLPIANFRTQIKFPLTYQLSMGLNSRTAPRDLAPKWGQNIGITYRHLPFDNAINGENLYVRSIFYFPGIMTNHSFRISANWQNNSGVYNFDIDLPRASGFANLAPLNMISNTLLLDYRFPIAYPDLELGSFAYIKRIKGGVFTDFENIADGKGLRTYGAELRADMNLLRYFLPNFDLGGRIIFSNENSTRNPIFEFGINFNY